MCGIAAFVEVSQGAGRPAHPLSEAARDVEAVVSSGVEMMSRVPLGSNGGDLSDTLLANWQIVPQGISAEAIASEWDISREDLDAYSLESHRRAAAAADGGRFDDELVPVQLADAVFAADETPRRDTSAGKLASLPAAFVTDGRVTAGNSSQIVDGAANGAPGTALELGNYSRFPAVSGVALPDTSVQDWYRFTMNRKGDGLDAITLVKQNAADPLVLSLVGFAILVAFLIFLPDLIWMIQNHFPHLELLANIRRNQRNVELSPLQFMAQQIVFMGPLAAPVWLAGLWHLVVRREGRPYRGLGFAYVVTIGVLLAVRGRVFREAVSAVGAARRDR